jgi:hypothetical protein
MKKSIQLYINHLTDWEQSVYVIINYREWYDGDQLDDLNIDNWQSDEIAEWLTEDIILTNLETHLKTKKNEQPD